jgi:dihydroflavonol-4-reductase
VRTLVTGATGFLGSHLARALLDAGHEVAVLRRAESRTDAIEGLPVEHRIGDLEDAASVERAVAGRDAVFHVAGAYSLWEAMHPRLYRVNVLGTRNVVRACLRSGARLVKTGSCAPYCGTEAPLVCDEDGNPSLARWRAFHIVCMALAEREVLEGAARGLHAVSLHPGLVFGERDVNFHAAWVLVAAARDDLFSRFFIPGGINVADVRDIVRAHILALERGRRGESYLVGGENLTGRELVALAEEVVGRGPRWRLPLGGAPLRAVGAVLERVGRWRGDDRRNRLGVNESAVELSQLYWWFSCRKAARELGYEPGSVRPALERAWRWLEERRAARARG